jgi:rRNA-processing protein FCF1
LENQKEIHVFLDANLALHYKRPDKIDWLKFLGASKVILVVTPVFIRELEKNKVNNTKNKLRKRAAQFITWLEKISRSTPPFYIRDCVSILFIQHEPNIDFSEYRLSHSIPDDELIASVITFNKENPQFSIAVVTADFGLRMKLRAHGIDIISLPDNLLLPKVKDKEEMELERLKKEVAELKSRHPKLSLQFLNNLDRIEIPLTAQEDLEKYLIKEMDEIKKRYPKIVQPDEIPKASEPPDGSKISLLDLKNIGTGYESLRINKYNQELDHFYLNYEYYLKKLWQFKEKAKLRFKVELVIINNGSAPATNINIIIQFPKFVEIIDPDKLPDFPKKPNPPSAGVLSVSHAIKDIFDRTKFSSQQIIHPWGKMYYEKSVRGPIIDDGKNQVSFWVKNIKHNFSCNLNYFIISFQSEIDIQNFNCSYKIFPD